MGPQTIVTKFNDEIGYGIARLADGTEVYIHRHEISVPGVQTLRVGDRIAFDVYRNGKDAVATDIGRAVREDPV